MYSLGHLHLTPMLPGDIAVFQIVTGTMVSVASALVVRSLLFRISALPGTSLSSRGQHQHQHPHPVLKAALQRLPLLLLAVLITILVLGPSHSPLVFCATLLLLNAEFVYFGLRSALGLFFVWRGVVQHSRTDWEKRWQEECHRGDLGEFALTFDHVSHVIVIPNYKEDLDSLKDTLAVLASHRMARTNYRVCLAMEAAEQGSEDKAQTLLHAFKTRFADMVHTIHTLKQGEIRGKSSNVNHAVRELAKLDGDRNREVVSVFDADTCFAADYFECISYHFCIADPVTRRSQVYFAPVLFDRNTHSVSPVIRIIDVAWSTAVMSMSIPGYPLRLALSTYSIPMDLAIGMGFWDTTPEAMGEDYHTSLKCYLATQGRLKTVPVFSPSSQCHIAGQDFWREFRDRWVQMKRHAWGVLDFSYGVRMALTRELERLPESYFEAWSVDPSTGARVNLYQRKRVPGGVTLTFLYFHLYETFIFPVHVMFASALVPFVVPGAGPAFLQPLVSRIWGFLGGGVADVHPLIPVVLQVVDRARGVFTVFLVCLIVLFEMQHEWCANKRWDVKTRGEEAVKRLGKRSVLAAGSRQWVYMLEWPMYLGVPVFMGTALVWTKWRQLFTDQLLYVVAAKPVVHVLDPVETTGMEVDDKRDSVRRRSSKEE